jgi:hypothetical protein
MNGGAIVSHNGMPLFHVSLWEPLRKAFRRCAASLAQADLAIREEKALEQLHERIVGSYGVKRMQIEDPGREWDARDIRICFVASRSLTPEEDFLVRRILMEVNRRYDMKFRLSIVKENKRDIKEEPNDVKKS